MTDQELRDLVASMSAEVAKAGRELAETGRFIQNLAEIGDRRHAETERVIRELNEAAHRRQKESDRESRQLRQQLGGLADKFGSYTEALALPSMKKQLIERFGVTCIAPRLLKRRNGQTFEIDVMGYSENGVGGSDDPGAVFLVEVKSHLRQENIEQLLKALRVFFDFFPEHRDKKLYGIMAVVDGSEALLQKVLQRGLYLARVTDGIFDLEVPDGFEPRDFSSS